MLRIVLIDDELLIRQGLASIIGRLCPSWVVIGSASNGEEGIELLESLRPDAAIVDVRMTGISGLDMISLALSNGLTTSFIILSGHGEFQFVQRAMRMGVYDYLLKPIRRNELVMLLEKLESKLIQLGEDNNKHLQLIKYKQESELSVLEKTVSLLIEGELLKPGQILALEESDYFFERDHYILFRMEIDPESLIGKVKTRKDEQLFRLFFHQVINELILPYGKAIIVSDKDDSLILILFFNSTHYYSLEFVGQLTSQIKKVIKDYSKLDVTIGISSLLSGMQQVKTAYHQAINSVTSSLGDRHILKAIEYIQKHYFDKLSLEEVAVHVHLHPTYLSELFHKKTGVHFTEYVTRVRLDEAKRLLRFSTCKIEEVSERSGFLSYRHFSRVFHKAENLSPSTYRKKFYSSIP
ncbi:response regulator [Paenibacillus agricola]|uniref:Response regulator n=1 Tax=Paenibacillus agricola TaxID=2716264 RepID=A0ABX0JD45_9BACL|nr:response regulator [Paenibacillus agricola]NHN33711.1 response regulator [Paenibacillus agricola]